MIAVGIKLKIPKHDRLCPLCVIPVDLRQHILPSYFIVQPTENKFIQIFSSHNVHFIQALVKYVFLAFKKVDVNKH